jgi:hypothetical protein
MMIAFSTQPGNVALDGEGRNSPFTTALLRHIATDGASINDVMIDVRNDVLKATDGKQVPWENSSLTGQFFFKPAAPPTIADKSAETASQIEALHNEIAKLQADQRARLTAQQLRRALPRGLRFTVVAAVTSSRSYSGSSRRAPGPESVSFASPNVRYRHR